MAIKQTYIPVIPYNNNPSSYSCCYYISDTLGERPVVCNPGDLCIVISSGVLYSCKTSNIWTSVTGTAANGLPAGGTTNQLLIKSSNTDFDASWGTSPYLPLSGSLADITNHSHTVLTDIGTNTHAQIDTALGTTIPATYLPFTGGTLTGALNIEGSTDIHQLIVKANATQAQNLVEFQTSTGVIHSFINGAGTAWRLQSVGGTFNSGLGFNSADDRYPLIQFLAGATTKAQMLVDVSPGSFYYDILGTFNLRNAINGGTTSLSIANTGATTHTLSQDVKGMIIKGTARYNTTPVQTGTGLSDITVTGTGTDTVKDTFIVQIDGTGSPNTFKWNVNGGAYTTGVAITGSAQLLANGISVTFAATTGHTLSDSWTWTTNLQLSNLEEFQNTAGTLLRGTDYLGNIVSTTTGIKIATATSQKLGFWNATPVAQPAHIADPTGGLVTDAEARAAIASINAMLASTGLTAAS